MFIIEISFYITNASSPIIALLTLLIDVEEAPFIKQLYLKNDVSNEISHWKRNLVRICASFILVLPCMFNFNEYILIVLTGAALSPFVLYLYPILCYNHMFRNHKGKRFHRIFNIAVLVVAIGLNLWSVIDEFKDKPN